MRKLKIKTIEGNENIITIDRNKTIPFPVTCNDIDDNVANDLITKIINDEVKLRLDNQQIKFLRDLLVHDQKVIDRLSRKIQTLKNENKTLKNDNVILRERLYSTHCLLLQEKEKRGEPNESNRFIK